MTQQDYSAHPDANEDVRGADWVGGGRQGGLER